MLFESAGDSYSPAARSAREHGQPRKPRNQIHRPAVRALLGHHIERKLHFVQDSRDLGHENGAKDSSAFGARDVGNLASLDRQQQPGAFRIAELGVRQDVFGRLHEHPSLSITRDQRA